VFAFILIFDTIHWYFNAISILLRFKLTTHYFIFAYLREVISFNH